MTRLRHISDAAQPRKVSRADIAACLSQMKLEAGALDAANPDDQEMGISIVGHSRAIDKIMALLDIASQPPAAPVETNDAVDVLGDPRDHCDAPRPQCSAATEDDDPVLLTDKLLKLAAREDELSHDCDMRPEDTANYEFAKWLREAATTIGAQAMRLEVCDVELAKLRSAVPQEAPNRENLRPFAEWADRNRSAVSHEAADELILLARKARDTYGALLRPQRGEDK